MVNVLKMCTCTSYVCEYEVVGLYKQEAAFKLSSSTGNYGLQYLKLGMGHFDKSYVIGVEVIKFELFLVKSQLFSSHEI